MPRRRRRDNRDRDRRKRRAARMGGGGKGKNKKKGDKDWLAPLTFKKAKREARRRVNLEVRPEQRAIMGEIRASQRRSGREIPSWFADHQKKIRGSNFATQAAYAKVGKEIDARSARSSVQDESVRKNIASEEAESAKSRGMAPEADKGRTDPLAQASSARRNLNDTFANLVGTQRANQFAYMSDKDRIAEGEKINQRLREVARERSYSSDLRELARRKGQAIRDEMGRLRDSEREYGLALQEFGEGRKSRRGQLKLARQYGKNKKKEQKRSFRNQKRIAGINAANKRAEQRRSAGNQRAITRLQARIKRAQQNRSTGSQKRITRLQAKLKRKQQNRSARNFPPQGGKKKRRGKNRRPPRRKYGGR